MPDASIGNVQAATSRSSVQVCIVPGDIEKQVRQWVDLLVPESTMPAQTYDDSVFCDGLHKNCLRLGRGWAGDCADLYWSALWVRKPQLCCFYRFAGDRFTGAENRIVGC